MTQFWRQGLRDVSWHHYQKKMLFLETGFSGDVPLTKTRRPCVRIFFRNRLEVPFEFPLVRDVDMEDVVVEYTYRTYSDPSKCQGQNLVFVRQDRLPEGTEPQGPPQSSGPDNPAPPPTSAARPSAPLGS
eukprot:2597291-Pyramimonas_sp.AAC.1